MAKVLVDLDTLENGLTLICDKIRVKTGGTGVLAFPVEMAAAVESIETGSGGITPTGTKEITENGTYDVTSFAAAEVTVPVGIPTAMDGGRTTVDGYITAQSADGTSLSYQDQSFRGEDVVGCWIEKKIIGSELFKIYAMLILPTEKTALGGVRLIVVYHDAVKNVCATTHGVYASGYSFTVTEHGIAVSLPSDASEKFIADEDYLICPIRGNGRT